MDRRRTHPFFDEDVERYISPDGHYYQTIDEWDEDVSARERILDIVEREEKLKEDKRDKDIFDIIEDAFEGMGW